ncbi:hypothetical protein THI_p0063 (plasmid) [Thiomonas arsenitoxydans]|uniref:Uncharacterized protein n=1 Tax=Thiomonas arsenitoxydans (strain DSM 22701 / CIP 110005 / 3As) TaxID=426114 RepID=D6CVX0_THIA3|nr:hypothetical protein THI_p0063 [Thiomonas arsenitoxydans]
MEPATPHPRGQAAGQPAPARSAGQLRSVGRASALPGQGQPVRELGGGQATRGGGGCKPSPRRQAQRAAPTARRRQRWKPARGETGADRLDAQHDSPARKGDAQDWGENFIPLTLPLVYRNE